MFMAIKGVFDVYFLIGDEQAEVGIYEWIKRYNKKVIGLFLLRQKRLEANMNEIF